MLRLLAGSLVGKVGMWLFVALVAVTALHVLVGIVTGLAMLFGRQARESVEGVGWLYAAQAVRVVEAGLDVGLSLWLARANGYI